MTERNAKQSERLLGQLGRLSHMFQQRHAPVAELIVRQLESDTDKPHLGAAVQAARSLEGVQGFEVPS